MKWNEGAYFASWLNFLGNDDRLEDLLRGDNKAAMKALEALRTEFILHQEATQLPQERT